MTRFALGHASRSRLPLALAAAGALSACAAPPAVAPSPPPAVVSADDRFYAAPADAPRPGPDDLRWWRRFDDPALADWVERALSANPDLQLASVLVEEARALLRAANAARAPIVTADARVDAGNRPGVGGRRVEPGVGLAFDWDADLWGARAWTERSAAARALRSEHLAQATRLSVAALTARAYLALREAQQAERQLADERVLLSEVARLVQVRVDAGLSPRLDGLRARGEVAANEAEAAAAADAVRGAARALQLLAGERPGAAAESPAPAGAPESPARATSSESLRPAAYRLPGLRGELPLTLPIDLLRMRPDLRAAEQALRAAEADLGAAEASRRPTLRLPGLLTLGTSAGGALLSRLSADLAVALGATLFDGGRLEAARDVAQARVRVAETAYRQTLLQALADVEAALTATAASRERIAAQRRALEQAEAAVGQSRTLYTAGLAGFIDVLDAQRTALARRQALLRMRADAARASVATFEALGLVDEGAGARAEAGAK